MHIYRTGAIRGRGARARGENHGNGPDGAGAGASFQDIEEMNGIGRRAKSRPDNYLLTALCTRATAELCV